MVVRNINGLYGKMGKAPILPHRTPYFWSMEWRYVPDTNFVYIYSFLEVVGGAAYWGCV